MPPSDENPPEKDTVALDEEEFSVLNAIRTTAPEHHIDRKLAQAYGVWTICFRRYCRAKDVPWLWMSSVSDFMDFLDAHPKVSSTERDRALDGIMFYITDVHEKQKKEDSSDAPRSTQSLFAKMLLRCDMQLTEALQIRLKDVDPSERSVTLSAGSDRDTRTVSLPPSLNKGLKRHLERVANRTDAANPLLFRHRDDAVSTDAEIERSTELATQVMQTLGDKPDDQK